MVVAPGVAGRERLPAVGGRCLADEPGARRMQQVVDRPLQPLARHLLGLAWLRPEAGAPEQPFSFLSPERTVVDGNLCGGHHLMKVVEPAAVVPFWCDPAS
jgi:hypothetical protein